jgi:purine-binding chemotaxis protein CheW
MSYDLKAIAAPPGKYLTVALGDESYGIAVLKVREIIRLHKITPVPQMPPHVRGVINLRGKVIPIVDLRIRFGLPAEASDRTCIVVVMTGSHGLAGSSLVGLVVDRVSEVAALTAAEITAAPEIAGHRQSGTILGIARVRTQITMLLDIDRLLASNAAAA